MKRWGLMSGTTVQTTTEQGDMPTVFGAWLELPANAGPGWTTPDGGATWAAPVVSSPIPARVPMADALHVLLDAGITETLIRAKIAAIPDPVAQAGAAIDFERLPYMRRQSALVTTLGHGFGLDDTQIDAMFVAADARSRA